MAARDASAEEMARETALSTSDESSDDELLVEETKVTRTGLREELEEYLASPGNKISKAAYSFILKRWSKLESLYIESATKVAYLKGRVAEKKLQGEKKTSSFADVLRAPRPRVGRRVVEPRQTEKMVFVYPVDEAAADSEVTKKEVKKLIAPKEDGWKIHLLRKVRRGGVIIEAGSQKTVERIQEAVKAVPTIRCSQPARILPRVRIFDVDKELGEAEIRQCLYKQNLCDAGFTEQQVVDEVKCRFKTPGRYSDICNWVLEVSSRVRNALLVNGRVFIDFSSCRVVDYLGVTRCFKCQGYGHVAKHCNSAGPQICSHCGDGGHSYVDCAKKEQAPVCAVCKLAKKPSGHRGGTRDCPIYLRALERRVAMTHYNGQ